MAQQQKQQQQQINAVHCCMNTRLSDFPHLLSSNDQQVVLYQVFFLPTDSVDNPSTFTAFCPFTGIMARGTTIFEAAQNWTKRAQDFSHRMGNYEYCFIIPKYVLPPFSFSFSFSLSLSVIFNQTLHN
jgi:hypothetical protein